MSVKFAGNWGSPRTLDGLGRPPGAGTSVFQGFRGCSGPGTDPSSSSVRENRYLAPCMHSPRTLVGRSCEPATFDDLIYVLLILFEAVMLVVNPPLRPSRAGFWSKCYSDPLVVCYDNGPITRRRTLPWTGPAGVALMVCRTEEVTGRR